MTGSPHLLVQLPGFTARVEAGDAAMLARLQRRYARFATGVDGAASMPHGTLQIRYARHGGTPARAAALHGATLDGTSLVVGPADAPLALLDRATGSGHVVAHASMLALDVLLRAEMTLRALDAGGLALHAAAVVLEGGAHVFAGVSGAGKSTVAARLRGEGATVLCDEFLVLHRRNGRFLALGTPFWEGRPAEAPVVAAWRLGRGDDGVHALPRGAAGLLRHLVLNLALPVKGPGLEARALEAAAALAGTAPGFELRYLPGQPIFQPVARAVSAPQQGSPQP